MTQKHLFLFALAMLCASSSSHIWAQSTQEAVVELTSSRSSGNWQLGLMAMTDDDKAQVWVDLNNNDIKDEGEALGMWDWMNYSKPRTSNHVKIHGPITKLTCSFNDITTIATSPHHPLQEIECTYAKGLQNVDFSKNEALQKIKIYGCKLTSIKLPSQNSQLTTIDVNDNEIKALNFGGCAQLERVDCFQNKLNPQAMHDMVTSLPNRAQQDKAGMLVVLYSNDKKEENEILKSTVGQAKAKNWKVKYFSGLTDYEGSDHSKYTTALPHATLATSKTTGHNWKLKFDAGTSARDSVWIDLNNNKLYDYGEELNVFNEEIMIPVTESKINLYGNLSKLIVKENKLTQLNIDNLKNIQLLDCSKNELNSIDCKGNASMTELYAYNNRLNNIDLSQNPNLISVSLNNNQLSQLKLAPQNKITILFVSNNKLTAIDVKQCTQLATLAFENNQIAQVALDNNTLESIYCKGNLLSNLDVSKLNNLAMLSCEKNKLTSLILPTSNQLSRIDCYSNQLNDEAITTLCAQLPQRASNKKGLLFVIDTKDNKEGNVCSKTNVATAQQANWIVYDNRRGENAGQNPYEGTESTGVDCIEINAIERNAIYDTMGRKLNAAPQSGLYIQNGKLHIAR